MQIIINGQSAECADGATVAQLLEELSIPTAGTAVARNDVLVRRAGYADTTLQPGDRVEIIHAVAGG